jgi:hypothetical protein
MTRIFINTAWLNVNPNQAGEVGLPSFQLGTYETVNPMPIRNRANPWELRIGLQGVH